MDTLATVAQDRVAIVVTLEPVESLAHPATVATQAKMDQQDLPVQVDTLDILVWEQVDTLATVEFLDHLVTVDILVKMDQQEHLVFQDTLVTVDKTDQQE